MQDRNKIIQVFSIVFLFALGIQAQETINIEREIKWKTSAEELSFEGELRTDHFHVPFYTERIPIQGGDKISARFESESFGDAQDDDILNSGKVGETIQITSSIVWERRKPYALISFIPLKRNGNNLEKLESFSLSIAITGSTPFSSRTNTYTSVLSNGDIYKIATNTDGIHRLTYDFLKNNLGISNLDNINPQNIKIYGNGGGKLPSRISDFRHDDLVENAIFISGENDGSFDSNDFILFYAEGADKTKFNASDNRFQKEKNNYDSNNYYFIKIDAGNGIRISDTPNLTGATYSTNTFDDFATYHEDKYNLLNDFIYTSGSGQQWFGDKFGGAADQNTYNFNFPNIVTNEPSSLEVQLVGRKNGSPSSAADRTYFYANVQGQNFTSTGINATNTGNVERVYAYRGIIDETFIPNSNNLSTTITYNAPGAEGWLDFININFRSSLNFLGKGFIFRDLNSVGQPVAEFQITGVNNNVEVWNITNPLTPKRQQTNISGSNLSFSSSSLELQEFICFDRTDNFSIPTAIGAITNQNLHSIDNVDGILVYHKDFEAAAMRLAEHRLQHSSIKLALAEISQIYNEFSSGSQDPTAIRDFAKMIYDRYDGFKYLVLFGDGSYDYQNKYGLENQSNFVPVFETVESLDPIQAFPSDDYYSLLSNNEGGDLRGALDIATGRIPVKTQTEATEMVDKIIRYDADSNTLGNWRNELTFVADDEDNNLHLRQGDGIAMEVDTTYKNFNLSKIYFDAFQQVSSSGGNTYPEVQSSINNNMFKGHLIINYLGHGGPTSWAQERVLQETDINSWTNENKLPLFVTATCSFTPYDDANRVSAGEQTFLKPDGGSIALFSTVRAVYASSNERLTRATFQTVFEKVDGKYPTIGEILRLAKNKNAADTISTNARRFTLIGDPTLNLAMPQHNVETLEINGQTVSGLDTLSALGEVTVSGIITDDNGNQLTGFNGTIFPTVFDKEQIVTTLANDPNSSPRDFLLQKNILFKGAASVTNGAWSFSFVVPKDIDYNFGRGKISYYAQDNISQDAAGAYCDIVIGGTSDNPIQDDNPPLVEVFMDNEDFVFGGITSSDPVLLVKLSDDYGINVAGTGIGHDLTAVIDGNNLNTLVLNDFYESEVDNPRKGIARYPLSGIAPGLHTVRVKGWDIANNSGEGYTEFVVAEDAKGALAHVLNYPNPFTTHTEFQFEHNYKGQPIRVQIQVFTVSGKLVKTISEEITPQGHRVTGIEWDGTDDYGDKIGRGVYLYKVKVGNISEGNANNTISSDFEKLVILR